ALAPHHSGIGRILNQRMLEEVGRIRWFSASEDQLGGSNMRERGLQRGGRWTARPQRACGKRIATYSGANLLGSVFVCDDPQPFPRDPASSHRLGNSLKFKFVMAGRLLNITLPNSIKVSASMRKLE